MPENMIVQDTQALTIRSRDQPSSTTRGGCIPCSIKNWVYPSLERIIHSNISFEPLSDSPPSSMHDPSHDKWHKIDEGSKIPRNEKIGSTPVKPSGDVVCDPTTAGCWMWFVPAKVNNGGYRGEKTGKDCGSNKG